MAKREREREREVLVIQSRCVAGGWGPGERAWVWLGPSGPSRLLWDSPGGVGEVEGRPGER